MEGEEGYEDEYMFDTMDMPPGPRRDRPGEDEWDPEMEMQPIRTKKSRKSASQAGPSGVPKPKGKRGRPPKNKKPA